MIDEPHSLCVSATLALLLDRTAADPGKVLLPKARGKMLRPLVALPSASLGAVSPARARRCSRAAVMLPLGGEECGEECGMVRSVVRSEDFLT